MFRRRNEIDLLFIKEEMKMKFYAQVDKIKEKTQDERIFDLECQVSLLSELIIQLITEIKQEGLNVSEKLIEGESE